MTIAVGRRSASAGHRSYNLPGALKGNSGAQKGS